MSEQSQLGPSTDGSIVLDIGGDIGALIILTPPDLAGAEIEVSADAPDSPRTHVAVRERRGPTGIRYAAIYPALPTGSYTIWHSLADASQPVAIVGGQITQLDWR
ncbi:hypothetical protein [Lapillicoccus sp.]|uniref:hypothetical protein n=1 Tax=Lapillicoccus sp. TaxID=1909287 RepID=UPI0025D2CFE5|nr:hypothetical protein [Lapillicoccus sp.]